MNVMVGVTKRENETWRECVIRHALPHGLVEECLEEFDNDTDPDEGSRAWGALWEWDVCGMFVRPLPEGGEA